MLSIFPFLVWLAAAASAVLLIVLWRWGELRLGSLSILLAWFLLAAYLQFFAAAPASGTFGLVLQTLLAIFLTIRFRLSR